jgi:hypothetical protein
MQRSILNLTWDGGGDFGWHLEETSPMIAARVVLRPFTGGSPAAWRRVDLKTQAYTFDVGSSPGDIPLFPGSAPSRPRGTHHRPRGKTNGSQVSSEGFWFARSRGAGRGRRIGNRLLDYRLVQPQATLRRRDPGRRDSENPRRRPHRAFPK